jgi:hypothetical protein
MVAATTLSLTFLMKRDIMSAGLNGMMLQRVETIGLLRIRARSVRELDEADRAGLESGARKSQTLRDGLPNVNVLADN